jgi:CRISPR-associated protein Csm4
VKYLGYLLHFSAGVHFGNGALWDSGATVRADTLFSALCHEALALSGLEGIEQLVQWAKNGELLLSDLLPYVGQELYLPKPLCPAQHQEEGNSIQKKNFKKLAYIPVSQWEIYCQGELDPVAAAQQLSLLGKAEVRTMSASRSSERLETGEALPYSVGVYTFCAQAGLYLIAGVERPEQEMTLDALLDALSYSGIGGKRGAGLGRFDVEKFELPNILIQKLQLNGGPCMTLSVCMAQPAQLGSAMQGASYLLVKRSGFVLSEQYSPEQRRKRDFYSFQAGSCFLFPFTGDVFDVAGEGAHPVYRYAVPLWLEV